MKLINSKYISVSILTLSISSVAFLSWKLIDFQFDNTLTIASNSVNIKSEFEPNKDKKSIENREFAYRSQTIKLLDGTIRIERVAYAEKVNGKWIDLDSKRFIFESN